MRAGVVIPVREDPDGLAITLASLAEEPVEEVVVVVDGADLSTAEVARRAGARVVLLDPAAGSYAARNAGVDALGDRVDAVLFTDADCRVRPGWVVGHLRALEEADLSGGAVQVTYGHPPTPAEWVDACRNLRQQSYVEQGGYAATCNLAVRRALLETTRFDGRLRSGGDRELCRRAVAAGARLAYTADAAVEHPARRTADQLLSKARRVGTGIADLPPKTRAVPRRPRRPDRSLVRRAQEAGIPTPLGWSVQVARLDHRRASVLHQEWQRATAERGLHVVVLLGSRWSTLESMNTRWRQVVQSWVEHPDVGRLTLVDHPRFRRRTRRVVRPAASWLPGVEVLDLTVPTSLAPGPADGLAWGVAGAALRRALGPPPRERVVISTSPASAPLLRHLAGPGTTTVFDAVDVWANRNREGHLGARLRRGYDAIRDAETVTAVSETLATGLAEWTEQPVSVVRNGVELGRYERLQPAPQGLPDGPFAVYVGSLSSRLDLPLVLRVSELLADSVPVVLAGPATGPAADALRAGAARWIGPVATALVPGLLQRAAVALYPHLDTDLTEATDSMKVLEYAAAGLPLVATDVPGLPPGTVRASDAEGFADAVRRAASQPRRGPAEWVQDRSWPTVADALLRAARGYPDPVEDGVVG